MAREEEVATRRRDGLMGEKETATIGPEGGEGVMER
jgi:hypothetical protein